MKMEEFFNNKKFVTILISLALTNINFYSSIEVLKNRVGQHEISIERINNKLFFNAERKK